MNLLLIEKRPPWRRGGESGELGVACQEKKAPWLWARGRLNGSEGKFFAAGVCFFVAVLPGLVDFHLSKVCREVFFACF